MLIHKTLRRSMRRALLATSVLALLLAPATSFARLITSASDIALTGALVENFDSYSPGYFSSQDFLTGSSGFNISALANDLHIDDQFCGSFGTTGSCIDTLSLNNGPNDNFDVVFSGAGVLAFGFDLTALDTDWTIETYSVNDVLLNTYTVLSQSPGLTGFNRRGYFGATELLPVQYFTVRSATSDRALIDNFAFTPIPEPRTSVLAGLGLIGLACVGRKDGKAPTGA